MDEKYTGLKKQLSDLCALKPEQILLAEVHSSNIKVSVVSPFLLLPAAQGPESVIIRCCKDGKGVEATAREKTSACFFYLHIFFMKVSQSGEGKGKGRH